MSIFNFDKQAVVKVSELVEMDSNDAISNEIAIPRIIDRSRNASGGTLHCGNISIPVIVS